jgi:hypothetical protein
MIHQPLYSLPYFQRICESSNNVVIFNSPDFAKLQMDLFTSSKLHSSGSHFYEADNNILRLFIAIAA